MQQNRTGFTQASDCVTVTFDEYLRYGQYRQIQARVSSLGGRSHLLFMSSKSKHSNGWILSCYDNCIQFRKHSVVPKLIALTAYGKYTLAEWHQCPIGSRPSLCVRSHLKAAKSTALTLCNLHWYACRDGAVWAFHPWRTIDRFRKKVKGVGHVLKLACYACTKW